MRSGVLVWMLLASVTLVAAQDRLPTLDEAFRTGPEVGQPIPAFKAVDQNGRTMDFNSIKGPKGALIMLFRSADW